LEKWSSDGVTGISAIFYTEHVAGMSDADLQRFLIEQAGVDLAGSITISRREKYTFLNFGFQDK
jgi:hypothetical protein